MFPSYQICRANQLTGFYMVGTLVVKGLSKLAGLPGNFSCCLEHLTCREPVSTCFCRKEIHKRDYIRSFKNTQGRLSDCNGTRTHNHLIRKRTLNHFAKLAKWLSCVVSTYLSGAFDCMFLSCHVRVSEWIHTL